MINSASCKSAITRNYPEVSFFDLKRTMKIYDRENDVYVRTFHDLVTDNYYIVVSTKDAIKRVSLRSSVPDTKPVGFTGKPVLEI
jgi:hypothetical protein